MTNEEKIRLVLETLGADNVRQATRAMKDMEQAVKDVGQASTQAAGRGGVNGQGMLQLAYFIDDLQYGMRGIMNNIPSLIQSLGLGAGLAGVAGIAAVAVGALVEKHPEWFKWNEKVKQSLAELIDAIKAEEEAVKRQKEEVDKLGKSTSQRIEDILKLKEATESLKDAEDQLAEDRKNRKAADEAEKNAGELATDELKKQKEIVKSVITDAGLQGDLKTNLLSEIDKATPQIGDKAIDAEARKIAAQRVPFFDKMDEDQKSKIAATFRGQANASLQERRMAGVNSTMEGVFGGLINPSNQAEMDRSMQGLDQFLPGVSRELRNVYQFDQESADFEAGNQRWRGGRTRAARRAAERDFAAGERAAAQVGPNRGNLEEADIAARAKALAEQEAKDKARREAMAGLTGQLPDPVTMAAMRRQSAGIGVGAVGRMRQAEQNDMDALYGTFKQSGMSDQDARQMVGEYMTQGNEAFAEFAQANGQNAKNITEGLRAAMQFMQRVQQDQQEAQQIIQWMQNMATGELPNVRPPARARN